PRRGLHPPVRGAGPRVGRPPRDGHLLGPGDPRTAGDRGTDVSRPADRRRDHRPVRARGPRTFRSRRGHARRRRRPDRGRARRGRGRLARVPVQPVRAEGSLSRGSRSPRRSHPRRRRRRAHRRRRPDRDRDRLPSIVALAAVVGTEQAVFVASQRMFTGASSFTLLAIPFFVLAGSLMNTGGIAARLIDAAKVLVGRLPGSLAQTNVVANALFGSVSGAAVASAAAMGSTLGPRMKREGYQAPVSAAVNA